MWNKYICSFSVQDIFKPQKSKEDTTNCVSDQDCYDNQFPIDLSSLYYKSKKKIEQ